MYRFKQCVLILTASVGLVLTACSTQKDHTLDIAAIYQVLELRQQAVSNQDVKLYDSILFSEYSSSGVGRDLVLDDIKLTFERLPDIQLKMPRIRPDVKRNSARIMQSSFYRPSADKAEVEIKETLMFRRIEERWLISSGIELGLSNKLKSR